MQEINNYATSMNSIDSVRAFFGKVYNYMAGGLCLSGLVAWFTANGPLQKVFFVMQDGALTLSLIGWVAVLSPLVLVFMINAAARGNDVKRTSVLFWVFSALMGVSLATVFLAYTSESIVQAFLITAGSFFALSMWGYSTKRDLSVMGRFMLFGLFGVIIAMIVNIFMASSAMMFGINVLCVFIFAGLMAYDTQKLKEMYYATSNDDVRQVAAITGALALYLDFINLFKTILYFIGDRK